MQLKLTKLKITPRVISYCFYILIILLTLLTLSGLSLFLYQNFYQTITQSKEILILKEKVVIEMIDIKNFNQIIEKLNQKIAAKKISTINNPFD